MFHALQAMRRISDVHLFSQTFADLINKLIDRAVFPAGVSHYSTVTESLHGGFALSLHRDFLQQQMSAVTRTML